MKIDFNSDDINECQDAQKLRLLLNELMRQDLDDTSRDLLNGLIRQIESGLNASGLTSVNDSTGETLPGNSGNRSIFGRLREAWRSVTGPSRREMELSRQRKELIERAEHAEASAFDALAETAEVGRERDNALERLKELEEELARMKGSE